MLMAGAAVVELLPPQELRIATAGTSTRIQRKRSHRFPRRRLKIFESTTRSPPTLRDARLSETVSEKSDASRQGSIACIDRYNCFRSVFEMVPHTSVKLRSGTPETGRIHSPREA